MEQYWMPKELDFENLRYCLDNYTTTQLYIREIGSVGGKVKINEKLENNSLDFTKDRSGLHIIIDTNERFTFPVEDYHKGFALAYERIKIKESGIEELISLSNTTDPNDPDLPQPRRSTLRIVLDNHLMEIDFNGKVKLKDHPWLVKPTWKYWTIEQK